MDEEKYKMIVDIHWLFCYNSCRKNKSFNYYIKKHLLNESSLTEWRVI